MVESEQLINLNEQPKQFHRPVPLPQHVVDVVVLLVVEVQDPVRKETFALDQEHWCSTDSVVIPCRKTWLVHGYRCLTQLIDHDANRDVQAVILQNQNDVKTHLIALHQDSS